MNDYREIEDTHNSPRSWFVFRVWIRKSRTHTGTPNHALTLDTQGARGAGGSSHSWYDIFSLHTIMYSPRTH